MRWFKKIIDMIVKVMIPLATLTLMIGTARIFLGLKTVFQSETIAEGFDLMVSNILTMFIVIELLRSIIEYVEIHRLKITLIIDAALVFLLREAMIGIYRHSLSVGEIVALGFMLLVTGGIRTLAIVYSPQKEAYRNES